MPFPQYLSFAYKARLLGSSYMDYFPEPDTGLELAWHFLEEQEESLCC